MKAQRGRFQLLLVALLASFSTMPLFQPYFFASSDGLFHLYRLMEYDAVIRDGVLYSRWAPDFFFGYGLPLFNYYAPLTYYLGEIFRLFGAGFIDSFKLLVWVAMVLSGVGAYLYARGYLSPTVSLLAAVVYMYVPYHIVNLYYRGDIAEYVAYTWFPFILWSLRKAAQTHQPADIALAGFFYALLILTHNLSAFIFSGFLIVYCGALLFQRFSYQRSLGEQGARRGILVALLSMAASAILGAMLSAFFWLPALSEKSLVDFDVLLFHYDFHEHFPNLDQLLSTSLLHRYGVVFQSAEVFGYKLGALQALFLLLGAIALIWRWRHLRPALRVEGMTSLAVAAISFLFIFPISLWVWDAIPMLGLTQFPWRFLAFVALPSALLSGLIVEALPVRPRRVAAGALIVLAIVSSTANLSPIMSNVSEEDISPTGSIQFELTYGAIGTSAAAEYIPKWVKHRPSTSPVAMATILNEKNNPPLAHETPGLEATVVERKANHALYRLSSVAGSTIVLNTLYFPGWQALLDGVRVDLGIDEPSGLIKLSIPAGEHTLRIEFVETRLRLLADGISALGLAAALLLLLRGVRNTYQNLSRVQGAAPYTAPPVVRRVGPRYSLVHGTKLSWRRLLPRVRRPSWSRETMLKVVLVVSLVPAWLGARVAYDSVNAAPQNHRFPLMVNLDRRVMIEGYDVSGVEMSRGLTMRASPGSTVQISLFWRFLERDLKPAEYRPFARLTNSFDQTWAYVESDSAYPEASSRSGSMVDTKLPLAIPPAMPPGVYQIEVGLQSVSASLPLEVARAHVVPMLPGERGGRIGPLIVDKGAAGNGKPARLGEAGHLADPVDFQRRLGLLDYKVVDGEALRSGRPGNPLAPSAQPQSWTTRAGETVHIDLLWRAREKMGDDLVVTARLSGVGRTLWAVRDSQPADGTYPTTFWASGEVVRDQLSLRVPAETPPGRYTLELEVVAPSGPLSIIDRHGAPIGPTLKLGTLMVTPPSSPASVKELKAQNPRALPVGDVLTLVGYTLGRPEAQPGERVHLDLYWLANAPSNSDLRLILELLDQGGKAWPLVSSRPVGDDYPTSQWRSGDLWRGQYDIVLPPAMPEGRSRIVARLEEDGSGQVIGSVDVDHLQVLPRSRVFTASPGNPLVREFENKIRLLGYDAVAGSKSLAGQTPVVVPPQKVEIKVYWQAMAEMATSYTVFVQVLNSAGKLVAQHDAIPGQGESPTTGWIEGEVVADAHPIDIPADLPDGDYTVIAGLYDALSENRLGVAPGEDFMRLTQIKILR
ncbi:MAG: glycosyltransferase family 39 protein [Chloroflexi bacterium]|nr:glycosyltransferase family 39 protein [Chloroflexota bacterium]